MSEFRMGQAAELLGVSVDTVRRWADAGELPTKRTGGGQRLIDGVALASFAVARNNALTEAEPNSAGSARNRFTGIITRVVRDTVMAQIEIQSGNHRVVSLITREAADELGLEPGVLAVAVIKATNVTVERDLG
ncbi:MAG: TOBE domain-containing protein [Actinobacteria bacterium]|jgi:molybdopterin-binding protein|nr:TOBE domain-containing protein [Actinomycetota bacterium]MSO18592.1 helix-turn-helix domain-containing protein [Acidimicrobiia bacterium]GDX30559.1 MerR family transcriptional regulator [Actinomycetes bacterium]